MRLRLGLLAALLWSTLAFAPTLALAQGSGPDWRNLSPGQRDALKPLERDWSTIDAQRKQKWIELAGRFDRMSPDERGRVQQRMTDWVKLSPKQRNEARLNYQGARELSPQERQERWEAYKALPEEQRRSLAASAKANAAKPVARSEKAPPAAGAKVNTVPNPLLEARKPGAVAPGVVQARPGATTNLLSARPAQPPNQQTGLPKVAATPEFVDKTTLLPQRGPQGAAADPRRRQ
ncbi:DUF3106 domain-containing protein [uncultured Methylibium sp.]|uniref:DUF3106 domain-containing protein n=1 Tax=uncultured Methylibium sp. TaxID=381093 RepID=UPI0025F11B21|nr:DUF3106 domain-containing protein [uncultured Methylibium sp.]